MDNLEKLLKALGLDPSNEDHKEIFEGIKEEKPKISDDAINVISQASKNQWRPIIATELKNDPDYVKKINASVYPTASRKALEDIGKKLSEHGVTGEFTNAADLAKLVGNFVEQTKAKTPEDLTKAIEKNNAEWQARLKAETEKARNEATEAANGKVAEIQQGYALKDFFNNFMNATVKGEKGEIKRTAATKLEYLNLGQIIAQKGAKPVFEGNRFVKFVKQDGTDFIDEAGKPITDPNQFAEKNFADLYRVADSSPKKTTEELKLSQLANKTGNEDAYAKFIAEKSSRLDIQTT